MKFSNNSYLVTKQHKILQFLNDFRWRRGSEINVRTRSCSGLLAFCGSYVGHIHCQSGCIFDRRKNANYSSGKVFLLILTYEYNPIFDWIMDTFDWNISFYRVWRNWHNNQKSITQLLKILLILNISKIWLVQKKTFTSMSYNLVQLILKSTNKLYSSKTLIPHW